VLRDSHWAFGSPGHRDVYCVASWDVEARRGFVFLHNPTGIARLSAEFRLSRILELPATQHGMQLSVQLVKSAARKGQISNAPRLVGWSCDAPFEDLPDDAKAAAGETRSNNCSLGVDIPVQIRLLPTEVLVLAVAAG
ncbi:unnamed protein product, partial [Polarella glacialis]